MSEPTKEEKALGDRIKALRPIKSAVALEIKGVLEAILEGLNNNEHVAAELFRKFGIYCWQLRYFEGQLDLLNELLNVSVLNRLKEEGDVEVTAGSSETDEGSS